nr:hypothetical protein CFP56_59078 [Quercus suber]
MITFVVSGFKGPTLLPLGGCLVVVALELVPIKGGCSAAVSLRALPGIQDMVLPSNCTLLEIRLAGHIPSSQSTEQLYFVGNETCWARSLVAE